MGQRLPGIRRQGGNGSPELLAWNSSLIFWFGQAKWGILRPARLNVNFTCLSQLTLL